jgi:hypothetical protein
MMSWKKEEILLHARLSTAQKYPGQAVSDAEALRWIEAVDG